MQLQATTLSLLLLSALVASYSDTPDDPKLGDCLPLSCGYHLNITYPFWIYNKQPAYCGLPQFNLICDDDEDTLSIQTPNGAYQVNKIFYQNQSIWVQPQSLTNLTCPLYDGNRTFRLTPFTVSSANMELLLLYNCIKPPSPYYFKLPCGGLQSFSFLNTTTTPEHVGVYEGCVVAKVPVLGFPGANGSDYVKLLKDGFLLEWKAPDCSDCTASGGECGYNSTRDTFMCLCNDRTHTRTCNTTGLDDGTARGTGISLEAGISKGNTAKIAVGATIAGIFTLSLFVLLCACRKKAFHNTTIFSPKCNGSPHGVESFLEKYGSIAPKRYKYSDVKKMTKSFTTKLGNGGYGTVYKGALQDGHLVAVKILNNSKGNGEDFVNEVASIGRTSHVNVVSLLGYCYEGSKRALIYEFMPNGSLEKFIFAERSVTSLGWERLFNIAVGIARGLEYLHRGCNTRILHFDIKPHNILLDDQFCPKISDFGLAKLCPEQKSIISITGARGTIGYIAPEVFSRHFGFVSSKSDVYSYGMMVMEIVGGRKNANAGADNSSEVYFPHWIYEHFDRDGDLELFGVTNEHEEIARKMVLVGLWCIQTAPENRPTMSRVLEMLEGSISNLQMPPKPYLSSPVRPSMSSIISSSVSLA